MVAPFPDSYPGTGTWLFRNISRDFTYQPRLSSILITQSQPEALANFDCEVVDQAEALVFANEDECEALWTPAGGSQVAIWRGHLNAKTHDSVAQAEQTRMWVISGQDYTAKLDDAIVRRRKKRKREKARRRIRWLLSYMKPNIWELAGRDLSGVPDGDFAYVEEHDYFGMTVREALQHVADELRLFFYVDFDNVFHMFRTETVAAPFELNNVAPDYSTSFPFREWTDTEESTELHNAFLVTPEAVQDSRWSADSTSIAAYMRHEAHISDSELPGAQAALNVGERALAQSKDPQVDAQCIVWEPGLYAGMTVSITEGLWGLSYDRIIQAVEIRAVDPHDEDEQAKLHTTLALTDRRPAGIGHAGATNRNTRRRREPGDPTSYPFDSYQREVSPPALTAGAALSFSNAGLAERKRHHVVGQWAFNPGQDDTIYTDSGFVWRAGRHDSIMDGWEYSHPHTSAPQSWGCACGALGWKNTGSYQAEMWFRCTVPAHPANMGGIEFDIMPLGGKPVAWAYGLEVVAMASQPTDMRQGTVVAHIGVNPSPVPVQVPAELVPAAGGTLYIGVRSAWNHVGRDNTYAAACGLAGHYGFTETSKSCDGTAYGGRSGSSGVNTPNNAHWLVYSGTAPDLGSSDTPSGATFDGGHTVHDAGTEGDTDAWSFDDGFSITAEEPSGKGIYYQGENVDASEPRSPWGDLAVGVEHTFSISAVGNTAAAGTRHIETALAGQGEAAIGTVHLGDGERDMGISVAGPLAAEFAAKAISTGERWRARIDTRSGQVRGKLWRVADGEPANWDVFADMVETEDDDDRYTLWLRAGNGAGNAQTVTVHRTRMLEGVGSGNRIVKEWLGRADGLTKRFYTSHQFRKHSLRVYVNGIGVRPVAMSGTGAWFDLDFWPTAAAALRATYLVR